MRRVSRFGLVVATLLGATLVRADVASARTFYFGNSLTGGTMPDWQPALARSAGRTWVTHAWLGAGWQLWQHREQLAARRELFRAASQGDLTLDTHLVKSTGVHLEALQGGRWDTVVLQLFAPHLHEVTAVKSNQTLTAEKDVGDVGAAADLIAWQLARNAAARFFIYQVWPMMEAGEPRDGKRGAEFPRRDDFDYAALWLQPYDSATSPHDARRRPWRSRSASGQAFAALQARFPDLWASGRLRLIPAGELLYELDRKFRAGAAPGIADIRDFYTDVQHLSAGLPRYTVAALMFAAQFEASPRALDWTLYNDFAKYGPDPSHDHTPLLEITPARARLVNETIDAVLAVHPHARLPRRDSP